MYELTKTEWKLLQDCVPRWQERYIADLLKEYVEVIEKTEIASYAFWEIENRIKADKSHPGVRVELRKSEAISLLKTYLMDGVIDFDDILGFSEELKNILKEYENN